MQITYVGRNLEVTDNLKDWVEKKFAKLDKLFHDDAKTKVTIGQQRNKFTVECTITSKNTLYRVEVTDQDAYSAIDRLVPGFERQIRKHKTRLQKHLKEGSIETLFAETSPEEIHEEREFNIVKTKQFFAKPMSPEEAILQMNLLDHQFFIFSEARNNTPCVVYKRKDGDYGMIELS